MWVNQSTQEGGGLDKKNECIGVRLITSDRDSPITTMPKRSFELSRWKLLSRWGRKILHWSCDRLGMPNVHLSHFMLVQQPNDLKNLVLNIGVGSI